MFKFEFDRKLLLQIFKTNKIACHFRTFEKLNVVSMNETKRNEYRDKNSTNIKKLLVQQ